jgi:RND family efflux transporter MFP subunit
MNDRWTWKKPWTRITRPDVALGSMIAALPVALLTGDVVWSQPADVSALETTPVVLESAPLERAYDGTVEAVNQATVSAQTSGRIAEIYYDVDDFVEAGSPIIRFTDVEQQAGLRRTEAALDEAEARLKEAEEEFRRTSQLFERGSSSQREYDQALAARDSANARVAAARSAVSAAEQQVEYTLVRAPYAGIVTERHVEVGETVSVGQPLMSGLSLETLRVNVQLPQETAAKVREHGSAAVLTTEGRVTPTDITVFPFADPATNTFTTRVTLPRHVRQGRLRCRRGAPAAGSDGVARQAE